MSKPQFKKGDKLRCVGWRTSNGSLRANAIYTALEDEEEPDCIGKAFVYVSDNEGNNVYCHSNRFVLHE